jgi:3-oxoacyl-[acyl-carrier protein] reductase
MTSSPASSSTTRIAVVTGAANGLGRLIAEELHRQGHRVVLTDRDGSAARDTARALGDNTLGLTLDVLDKGAFEQVLAEVQRTWGTPQVLVNNAALTLTTPVLKITPEEFSHVLDVNLRGTFLGCQVFGAAMAEAGHGRIVNLASLAGQNGGTASGAHYASSKAGILTLTKIFAREFAARGVTVNAVAPGPMDLPSVHAAVPPERLAQLVQNIPVQHLGEPRFVARLVALLTDADAGFATGAAWDVNGGIFMR